jgi:hypothetical protein
MPVIAFPHKQRRRAVAAERRNRIACEMLLELLALTYRGAGRDAFFNTCDALVSAVIGIRDHELQKEAAGLPLGPGAGVN